MKFEEVDINRAHGLRLSEELVLNNTILPKNHSLTDDDISLLKQMGRASVYGVWPEVGDIDFQTALGIAAAKITGKNLGFRVDDRGFCEIAATADGLLEVYPERLYKFNRFCPYFVLNAIAPFQMVKTGEIIARLEILSPVLAQNIIDDLVFYLSGNESLLNVRDLKAQTASLLYTRFYNDDNETAHLQEVSEKLTEIYTPLNISFDTEYACEHTIEEIGAQIEALVKMSDIVFIVPAVRNYTDNDVVMQAIKSIADDILCPRLPLFGGSDLIIATKKNKKIISLPYNYAFIDSDSLENFIKLAVTKPKLLPYDFNRPENAVIQTISTVKDLSVLIKGNPSHLKSKANIAAVILAAGQSKRLTKNKLLTDVDNQPLALKAVQAALKSDASPIFVVTGYQAEELEAELENYDVNIVYNPNYYTGVKTSISLGLKSVPDFCDGAMLIPADMPALTPEFLNKMIAKFKKDQENQLIIAEKDGIKSNPIIWSKSLYAKADLVPENADVRVVFMEHADYTTLVKASTDELLDVNFQNDLDEIIKRSQAKA